MEQFRPKTTPPLANPERLLHAHCGEEVYELIASLNATLIRICPQRAGGGAPFCNGRVA